MASLLDSVRAGICNWLADGWAGWNRFWFTPIDAATLGLVRILAGAMLLYTHLVWSLGLEEFFGSRAWMSPRATHLFYNGPLTDEVFRQSDPYGGINFAWSYFYGLHTPTQLWLAHGAALVVFALLTVGLFTRVMAVLAYIATLAYVHRTPCATFGLDQINTMLAMYLLVGPCGQCYSVDAWLRRRWWRDTSRQPRVGANVALRLIQIHMCVIYLFAGFGKLTGLQWWTGEGLWGAVANYEYQSLDATWLAGWPLLVAVMSHITVYWEVFYCAAIWPRWTRPVMLAIAIPLHLGIAMFMGMITFGLAMLIANLAFVPSGVVRAVEERLWPPTEKQPAAKSTAKPMTR